MQYQKNPRSRFGEKVFIGQLNWRWIHIYLKFISRNTEISNSIFPLFISFTFSHSTIKKDFFIKYLFSKCDEICCKLHSSHLLTKSLMGNFIFCTVFTVASLHILHKIFQGTKKFQKKGFFLKSLSISENKLKNYLK